MLLAAALLLSACATPEGRVACGIGVFTLAIASVSAGAGAPPANIYSVCDPKPEK
jgi:hypothetical protein